MINPTCAQNENFYNSRIVEINVLLIVQFNLVTWQEVHICTTYFRGVHVAINVQRELGNLSVSR